MLARARESSFITQPALPYAIVYPPDHPLENLRCAEPHRLVHSQYCERETPWSRQFIRTKLETESRESLDASSFCFMLIAPRGAADRRVSGIDLADASRFTSFKRSTAVRNALILSTRSFTCPPAANRSASFAT